MGDGESRRQVGDLWPQGPKGSHPLTSQACMPQALRGHFVYASAPRGFQQPTETFTWLARLPCASGSGDGEPMESSSLG